MNPVEQMQTIILEQKKRIAELEAALKPFAVIGRMLLASDFQDHELARGGIPAGDYRAAAAAMGGAK